MVMTKAQKSNLRKTLNQINAEEKTVNQKALVATDKIIVNTLKQATGKALEKDINNKIAKYGIAIDLDQSRFTDSGLVLQGKHKILDGYTPTLRVSRFLENRVQELKKGQKHYLK